MDTRALVSNISITLREQGLSQELVVPLASEILSGRLVAPIRAVRPAPEDAHIIKMMVIGETSLHAYHLSPKNFNLLGLAATISALLSDIPESAMASLLVALLASFSAKITQEEAALLVAYNQLSSGGGLVAMEEIKHRIRASLLDTSIDIPVVIDYAARLEKRGLPITIEGSSIRIEEKVISMPV